MTVKTRYATLGDSALVWKLRNEKNVREVSINKELIILEDHTKWFFHYLDEYKIIISDNKDIGYLRKERNGYISIALIESERNKGIGQSILEKTTGSAIILATNFNSLKCFNNAGYRTVGFYLEKEAR